MNKTKTLVASISTLLRRTYSSNFRRNPITTFSINSQTHLSRKSLEPSSVRGLQLSCSRLLCSESGEKQLRVLELWKICVFVLEKKYEIDAVSLEGKYKEWQKKLHPDLVHNKSKKERDYAADQSAKVTEALRTLTKRLSRAMYIMNLNGINVNEEETITDPTLLMEIMELREAIAEANDSKALDQIRSQVQEKLKQWSNSFVEEFERQRFDEAVKCIQRMTYYERACEEIVKKL